MVNVCKNNMNASVPAFLAKLWALVDDSRSNKLISWGDTGLSFIVHQPIEFSKDILPKYFKHNNMTSFIRQLNMYGFRKIANIETGSLQNELENLEFFHPHFKRGHIHLLTLIKRKPTFKNEEGKATSNLLCDISKIKNNQLELESKIDDIKSENSALWGELLYMRQKYNKQQIVVKKLIQFLMAMMAPSFKIKKPFMNHSIYKPEQKLIAIDQPKKYLLDHYNLDENLLTDSDVGLSSIGVYNDTDFSTINNSSKLPLISSPESMNNLLNIPYLPPLIQRGISTESQLLEDQTINQQSPLMEVVIDNDALINADESDELDLNNFLVSNPQLDNVSLSVNSPITSINQRDSNHFKLNNNFFPQALADHLNYANKPETLLPDVTNNSNKNNINESLKLNSLLSNILTEEDSNQFQNINNLYSTHQSTSNQFIPSRQNSFKFNNDSPGTLDLSFDDICEQMYDIIADDNGSGLYLDKINSMDVLAKPNISRDYFTNYQDNATYMDVKDYLSQSNLSIDSKLLNELLGSVDSNNDILGRGNDFLKIDGSNGIKKKENKALQDIDSITNFNLAEKPLVKVEPTLMDCLETSDKKLLNQNTRIDDLTE